MKCLLFFAVFYVFAMSPVWGQNSTVAPEYTPATYRSILVIAKIKDSFTRRLLETETVKRLQKKSIPAIAAFLSIPQADTMSDETFNQATDRLGIDGILVYTIDAPTTRYQPKTPISLGIGLPIQIGPFGVFLGTGVPLGGGGREVGVLPENASFFNRRSKLSQWYFSTSGPLERGGNRLAIEFARMTVKRMEQDHLFLP